MLLTEEDAKQKWCSHARHDTTGGNRCLGDSERAPKDFPCIGSACMSWRWSAVPERVERRIYKTSDEYRAYLDARFSKQGTSTGFEYDGHRWGYAYSDFDDQGEFDLISRPNPDAPLRGYCGLAGKVNP